MGTRSIIAVQRADSFESVYCHWDGYPSHNGRILSQAYTDPAKVDALIALGDLSSLRENVAPAAGIAHSFEKSADGVTVAYGRDRGETDIAPQTSPDLDALLKRADASGTEYVYVFTGDAWLYTGHGEFRAFGCGPDGDEEGSPWKPLAPVTEEVIAEEA